MVIAMKEQIPQAVERILKKYCSEPETPITEETRADIVQKTSAEFDENIKNGRTDIEAYREAVRYAERTVSDLFPKPQQTDKNKHANKEGEKKPFAALESLIEAVLWLSTVAAYFIISMVFGHWHLTWLIFLSSSIGSIIITVLFELNRGKTIAEEWDNLHGIIWLALIIFYFLLSFATGAWHLTWIIFIIGSAASVILDYLKKNVIK